MKVAIIVVFLITALLYIGSKLLISYIAGDLEQRIRIHLNIPSALIGVAGLMIIGYQIGCVVLVALILIDIL